MMNQPHEKLDLHPTLVLLEALRGLFSNTGIKPKENTFSFLKIKGAIIFIAPSQLILPLCYQNHPLF